MIKRNLKYKVFCLIICSVVVLLSFFKGMLYLSQNGYFVLEHLLRGSMGKQDNVPVYKIIVNGDYAYFIIDLDDSKLDEDTNRHMQKFFLFSSTYGTTEFYAGRKLEGVYYEIVNNIFIKERSITPEKYQKNIDMTMDYIESFWHVSPNRVSYVMVFESYASINEGRPRMTVISLIFLFLFQIISLGLLTFRISGTQKRDTAYRWICCIFFGTLQLLVLWMDISKYVVFL